MDGLTTLPSEVVGVIASFLPISSAVALTSTCKTLHGMLTRQEADRQVWRRFAVELVESYPDCGVTVGDSLTGSTWKSWRDMCAFLYHTIWLLGNWREIPKTHMGSLLAVRGFPSQNPTRIACYHVKFGHNFHPTPVIEIDQHHRVHHTLSVLHNPAQLQMLVRPVEHAGAKRLSLMLSSLETATFEQLNSHSAPDFHTDSFANPLVDLPARSPTLPEPDVKLLSSVAGTYVGDYGPHGPEIIHVRFLEGGMLCGVKVTGDPNVPAGKATFVSSGLATRSSIGAFSNCNCGFACACHILARLLPPTTPVFSLPLSACRVADTDFVNSRFLAGTVHLLYDPHASDCANADVAGDGRRNGFSWHGRSSASESSPSHFTSATPTTPMAPPRAILVQWNGFFSTLLKRWDNDLTSIQKLAMNRNL